MPTILVMVDDAGERVVLVNDDEVLLPAPGVNWRFVCDVDDQAQGRAVLDHLNRRHVVPASRPGESRTGLRCRTATRVP